MYMVLLYIAINCYCHTQRVIGGESFNYFTRAAAAITTIDCIVFYYTCFCLNAGTEYL
jgi:hypothetical protein